MSEAPAQPAQAPKPKTITLLPETADASPDVATQEIVPESNPFSSADWRMFIYAWSGFAVRIMIVLGGIFTVYQYLETREQGRVEKTLELVSLWDQDQYQAAQTALRTRLEALNEKNATLLGSNPGPTELRVYYRKLGQEAMTAAGGEQPLPAFRADFDRIVYFLNRVSFCVDAGICSRDVADAFFKDFATSFWGYFGGYVAQVRARGEAGYAAPLEAYAQASAR